MDHFLGVAEVLIGMGAGEEIRLVGRGREVDPLLKEGVEKLFESSLVQLVEILFALYCARAEEESEHRSDGIERNREFFLLNQLMDRR